MAWGFSTIYATCPALMPMPAKLGPTDPFLPPSPWQLAQFAEKTLAPALTLPAPMLALGIFASAIGSEPVAAAIGDAGGGEAACIAVPAGAADSLVDVDDC